MTFLTHSLGGSEWQFENLTLLSYPNPIPVKRKSKTLTLTRNYIYTNFLGHITWSVIKTVFRQGSILTCHVVRFEVKVRKYNYIDSSWFEQLKLLLSGALLQQEMLFLCGWPLNFPIRDCVFNYSYNLGSQSILILFISMQICFHIEFENRVYFYATICLLFNFMQLDMTRN